MAGVSKEELKVKRFSIVSLIVLLLAWSAAAQTGAQTQSNTTGSSSTNVSADKGGVKAQSDTSASTSQQTSAQRSGTKAQTNAAGNANASGSAAAGPNDASAAVGTTLNAVLTKSVDSRKAKEGDEVTAKTTAATQAEGQRTIPKGTKLIGHVTKANARAKGDSESALGIVFDRAEVAKGREVPIHAVVQALAVAKTTTPAMGDDSMGGMSSPPPQGSASGGSSGGSSGGLVGGAVNGVGNTVSRTTGTAANTAGSAVGAASGTVNNTAGSLGATASSTLSATSQGVVGLPGYTLDAAAANATQGSVVTSSGKNVKLDSGTQMVLRVVSE
jgi:hypothetical protein